MMFVSPGVHSALIVSVWGDSRGGGHSQMGKHSWLRKLSFQTLVIPGRVVLLLSLSCQELQSALSSVIHSLGSQSKSVQVSLAWVFVQ